MITETIIRELIEKQIVETDQFIVDLSVGVGNKIYVEMDCDSGFSIDKCVKISRLIEGNFDRELVDFELQVTSPGANRPFKVLRQYQNNVGKDVSILLINEKEIKGKLLKVDEEGIEVQEIMESSIKGRASKLKEEITRIEYSQINQTKVIISFK